jgi:hypothetical protein
MNTVETITYLRTQDLLGRCWTRTEIGKFLGSPDKVLTRGYCRAFKYALSRFKTALEALDGHQHWFDSLGLPIRQPLFATIALYCYQTNGKLEKSTRALMKCLGGYWEQGHRDCDAQGLLCTNTTIQTRDIWVHSTRIYILADGHCDLTGRHFHGLTGDPMSTNQEELAKCFKQI